MLPRYLLRAIPVFLVLAAALFFAGADSVGEDGDGADGAVTAAVEFDTAVLEPYREHIDELIVHALTEGKAYATLTDLCTTAPHRLSGSVGAAKGVEWAQKALKAAGCDKVWLEDVTVPVWVRGEREQLRYMGPTGVTDEELPILALGGSIGTPPEGITAQVVEVRSFEELAGLGGRGKGKIVFFNREMDRAFPSTGDAYGAGVAQRYGGANAAAKVGAVAVVVRSMTTALDDEPHTGAMDYADDVTKIPACAVSTLGAERLSLRMRASERVVMNLRMSCKTLEDAQSHNVIGEYRGTTQPDEIVLVGGHLDCWDVGQGAHDDGSGSIQSIEVVRLLHGMKLRSGST